ncbi:VSP [Giardia lamblia P15]|uniref:VSP n=1 Tax=Giardia intestinalis (strain P15) TaxID=658858 RepID=E1F8Q5_GIAIA|nr:VSP [Giardia lamblia P15]
MLFAVLYLALGTLAAPCQPDGDHVATCQTGKCETVGGAEICTECKAGGVPIDGFCWPASSPSAALAGCVPGASSGVCTRCSSEGHFLFMGGCFKKGNASSQTLGDSICETAQDGRCTKCKTDGNVFQNKADSPALGSECILCSDTTGANGNTGADKCLKCTSPAGSTGAATCKMCEEGYFLNTDGACEKCNSSCLTCSGGGDTKCISCKANTYLLANKCVQNNNCGSGKYADPRSNECVDCGIDGCEACEYSAVIEGPKCTACNGSNNLVREEADETTTCVDDTGCVKGSTHIVDNTNTKKCLRCGNNAEGGILGCDTCSSKAACTKCQDGYVKKALDNTCEACGNNCATCTTKGQCDSCLLGFFHDTGAHSCTACASNCETCTEANNPNRCTTCMPGFFPIDAADSQGKKCVACDSIENKGLEGCSACSNSGGFKCTDCKVNYKRQSKGEAPDDFICIKVCEDEAACGGTAGACDAVVIDDAGKELHYCSFCGDTSQAPINGKCVAAGSYDSNTCSKGVCTQCTANYFLYMNGCYKIGQTPGQYMCTAAATGFCTAPDSKKKFFNIPEATKQEQSVLACGNPLGTVTGADGTAKAYVGVPSCTACTPPSAPSNGGMAAAKCTACEAPKKPNQDGSGCTLCAVAECKSCITDDVCEVCENSKKPNKAGNACYACSPEGCSHCSADNRCEACADGGKRPSLDGAQCITCDIDRCTRCSAEGVCGECEAGYAPKDGKCEPGSTGPNLSTGAIAGISVAVVVVVGGLVGFLCWWFICRGKA